MKVSALSLPLTPLSNGRWRRLVLPALCLGLLGFICWITARKVLDQDDNRQVSSSGGPGSVACDCGRQAVTRLLHSPGTAQWLESYAENIGGNLWRATGKIEALDSTGAWTGEAWEVICEVSGDTATPRYVRLGTQESGSRPAAAASQRVQTQSPASQPAASIASPSVVVANPAPSPTTPNPFPSPIPAAARAAASSPSPERPEYCILSEPVTIVIASGVISFDAGEQVQVLERQGDKMLVTDGRYRVELDAAKLRQP
ncbi:MAG: hypothetical protein JO295_09390 [Verrucomicrobia bacterium]|nr:hypothetical protein [Verrucomicrobiota bacterium]